MWQRFDIHSHPGIHAWYQRIERRPGWVWKATVLTAVIVFAIPVMLLVLAAMLAAGVVFTVLSLVLSGVAFLRRLMTGGGTSWPPASRDDGRRNVRVRIRQH